MSRVLSADEVREQFLDHARAMVRYWANEKLGHVPGSSEDILAHLNGVTFSLLAALDGCSVGLPSFIVAPEPHPDDRQYHIDNGENWYQENHEANIKCDISGVLHEHFYQNPKSPTTFVDDDTGNVIILFPKD